MSGHATRGSTTRSSTKRTPVDLIGGGTDVQIKENRRFFSSRGNDRAVREAKAIADAFNVGTEFAVDEVGRRNVRGTERAIEASGAGGSRDLEDKNSGYNRAWDRLDDERSLNMATNELPQLLQEMDAENKPEKQVQAFISAYMKEQFDGIDTENEDHTFLAAGLLELEANVIAAHRDGVIEQTSEQQRSDIYANAKDRYDRDGVTPYEYLGEQTNIFFDGAEKRVVYWEMIYDIGIENGDPDSIRNVPERFASGDPTGVNDPKLLSQHRAAIRSATIMQAGIAKARQDAIDLANEGLAHDLMFAIYEKSTQGADVKPDIKELFLTPGVDFDDIKAIKNFADGQRTEAETRSPDLDLTGPLWNQIHRGEAGLAAIFFAKQQGWLGFGPQSDKLMNTMMNTARTVHSSKEAQSNPDVGVWRAQISRQYNAQLKGALGAIDPTISRIQISAHSFYTEQIANGTEAMEAFNKTIERFDPVFASIDTIKAAIKQKGLTNVTQSSFVGAELITPEALKAVGSGTASYLDVFAGVNPTQIIAVLDEALNNEGSGKELTEEEIVLIYSYID